MPDLLVQFFELVSAANSWRGLLQQLWAMSLLVACFIWGAGPEKASIAVWTIITAATLFINAVLLDRGPASEDFEAVNQIQLWSDIFMLTGFVAIAVFANRQYVFWLAGWQTIALLTHVLRAVMVEMEPIIYALMLILPGWMQLAVITAGLIAHVRRPANRFADWRWQVDARWVEGQDRTGQDAATRAVS